MVFIIFVNFQLIPHVLLTPTNFCFHDQVITGVLGNKWSPQKIGINLYWNELRNAGLSFPYPGYSLKCETNSFFFYLFFLYSFPGKEYGLRHIDVKTKTRLVMSPHLIKPWENFMFSIISSIRNISQHKAQFTQLFVTNLTFFYVGSIDESTEDMDKNFYLLQLIISEILGY